MAKLMHTGLKTFTWSQIFSWASLALPGTKTKWEVCLLRTWFGIVPVN